jgi:uncharacterized 2Fe-2S/4Fe-4S cluster protein (DUF4445 family)
MLIFLNNDTSEENQKILKIFIEKVKPLNPKIAKIYERNSFDENIITESKNLASLLQS